MNAKELKQKLDELYWEDLTDFERFVRNQVEYLHADRTASEPPPEPPEPYMPYDEYDKMITEAEGEIKRTWEVRKQLSPLLTPEQIDEGKRLAKEIFELETN